MKPKKLGRPPDYFKCECGKEALKVYVGGRKTSMSRVKHIFYCPKCDMLFKIKLEKL